MVAPAEVLTPLLMFPPGRQRPASASITLFGELVNTGDGINTPGAPAGMTFVPVLVAEVAAVVAAKGPVRITPACRSRTSSVEVSALPVIIPSAELDIDTCAGVVVDPDPDPDPDGDKEALVEGSVRMSRIRFMVDMVACNVGLNPSLLLLFCGGRLYLLFAVSRFLDVIVLVVQSD